MTLQEKQEFERRQAEYLNPFAFVPNDVCVIAYFGPGFSYDLSSWRLTLSTAGLLVQDVELHVGKSYTFQPLHLQTELGTDLIQQILTLADDLDFWNLKLVREGGVTDMPSLRILIRQGAKFRDYAPEAVSYHAHRDENARQFMKLWELIHSRAPFPES